MARNTTETSVCQQAFAVLNTMTDASRKDAAEVLMKRFDIGKPYAMTIYQKHRNSLKESGKLVSIFSVRDSDKGLSIVTNHVANPAKTDAKSPEAAVKQYVKNLQAKIDKANKLDVTPPAPKAKPEAKASKKGESKTDEAATATEATEAGAEATA